MGQIPFVGDLQVGQDLPYQRTTWMVQRIGWTIGVLLIVAALAGLMGEGPLSQTTAGGETIPFQVQYMRFARHSASTTLEFQLAVATTNQDTVDLWLDRQFVSGIEIEGVFPEPERVRGAPDRMIYTFALAQQGQPATITFNIRHNGIGPVQVRVGLDGHEQLSFQQFIYP